MKRGFTLLEMLVVMGIIAILIGAGAAGFSSATKKAQTAKALELVHEVKTALTTVYQRDSAWPPKILEANEADTPKLNEEVGAVLAKRGLITLTYRKEDKGDGTERYVLSGPSKFGIVTPWAEEVIKKNLKGGKLSVTTKVPTGGTVDDHILRFAIDDDGDGIVKFSEESTGVRATACVWCCGRDGKFGTQDDIRSWTKGQVVK